MMSADDVCWNVWTNIKKLYVRNNIFKKRIPNITFWIIYILAQISFLATALGRFSQCFFKFFVDGQAWWPTFLLSPSTIKKLSAALSIWNVLKSNGICPFYLIFVKMNSMKDKLKIKDAFRKSLYLKTGYVKTVNTKKLPFITKLLSFHLVVDLQKQIME